MSNGELFSTSPAGLPSATATETVRLADDEIYDLRVENRFDGVPYETQDPIPVGGEFTYRLQFPDDGLYWYHPHVREDYGLELGLYGAIVVEPSEPEYWPPVHREVVVT